MKTLDAKTIVESGILHEVNRLVLHRCGLAMMVDMDTGEISIIDNREDPEGVLFDKIDFEKVQNIRKQMDAFKRERYKTCLCGHDGIQIY